MQPSAALPSHQHKIRQSIWKLGYTRHILKDKYYQSHLFKSHQYIFHCDCRLFVCIYSSCDIIHRFYDPIEMEIRSAFCGKNLLRYFIYERNTIICFRDNVS